MEAKMNMLAAQLHVQEKAKGLLVAEDGSVPVPVPVADTP